MRSMKPMRAPRCPADPAADRRADDREEPAHRLPVGQRARNCERSRRAERSGRRHARVLARPAIAVARCRMRRAAPLAILGSSRSSADSCRPRARPPPLKDAHREAAGPLRDTKTMEADFQPDGRVADARDAAQDDAGKVAFEKPNHMRWDYDPPDKQTIVGDGETLWIYQPDMNQVIKAPLGEAFQARDAAHVPLRPRQARARLRREPRERDGRALGAASSSRSKDAALGTLGLTRAEVRRRRSPEAQHHRRRRDDHADRVLQRAAQRNDRAPTRFTFTPPPGVDVVKPPPTDPGLDAVVRRRRASSTCRRSTTRSTRRCASSATASTSRARPFEVRREDHAIHLRAADDFKLRALVEILQERLAQAAGAAEGASAPARVEPGPMGTAKQQPRPPAGHRDREGARDREAREGREAQGAGGDPGRSGAGHRQEARRPAGA